MSFPVNDYSLTRQVVDEKLKPRTNFRLLRTAILAVFLVLIFQLGQLQLAQGERYRSQANQNRYRLIQTDALRGIIYDRAGKILVRNIPSFNVSIVPADLEDVDEERVYKDLSVLLGVPIETVVENTSEDVAGTLPASLEREVTPPRRKPGIRELVNLGQRDPFTPVIIKSNVSREVAFYIEERHLDFPGVRVGLEPVREYPEGALLAHIIGYDGHIPRESYTEYKNVGYAPNDQVGPHGSRVCL
jgi:penicillin-binding protein 2